VFTSKELNNKWTAGYELSNFLIRYRRLLRNKYLEKEFGGKLAEKRGRIIEKL
jgi:hypothetical protein